MIWDNLVKPLMLYTPKLTRKVSLNHKYLLLSIMSNMYFVFNCYCVLCVRFVM